MADLNQALMQALFKIKPTLRTNELSNQLSNLVGHSDAWKATQASLSQQAANAGMPVFTPNDQASSARQQLIDAIGRSEKSGFIIPHFIGKPYEPLGDRGVTMDIENLVKSLKDQEAAALKAKDNAALDKISKERAYWEKEAASGMSAAEWKAQTGENDPNRFFVVNPPTY